MPVYTAEQKRAFAKKQKERRAKAMKATGGQSKVRVSRQVKRQTQKIQVEQCSQNYLLSLINPYKSIDACIPSSFPLKSQKVHVFNRGTLSLGTTGVGYITCTPTLANDTLVVTHTQGTSVGTSNTSINAFTNLINLFMLKIPFSSADIAGRFIQGRIVSCGLRVRYIGRSDALNGLIRSIEEPDHSTLAPLTPNEIYSYDQTSVQRPSESEWTSVNYSGPTTPNDVEFANVQYPLGNVPFMAHIIAGLAGDEYAWEIYENIEYIGKLATSKTLNGTDPRGYAKVSQVIKGASSDGPITPQKGATLINDFAIAMGEGVVNVAAGAMGVNSLQANSALKVAYDLYKAFTPRSTEDL